MFTKDSLTIQKYLEQNKKYQKMDSENLNHCMSL